MRVLPLLTALFYPLHFKYLLGNQMDCKKKEGRSFEISANPFAPVFSWGPIPFPGAINPARKIKKIENFP